MAQHHEIFMQRCLQLALLGKYAVAPNPMVGAVLVHEGRIIGEGYHKVFGGAHAEVECLASVRNEDRDKIERSTLYVSLEPCAHHGKTPPCTDLILAHRIPEVVIGCTDTHQVVSGRGIALLAQSGVSVINPVLEKECRLLNERFFTFHEKKRPWVMLKWAASANGKIGKTGERVAISSPLSNRLVHKWRSESAAIMVATNTALYDDPLLTNRYWGQQQPLRILLDMHLRLPSHLKLFQDGENILVFNGLKEAITNHIHYVKLNADQPLLSQ
ncbi:MAG: bifunctional diaminohydroxyphosphoribosylaminopyrimidine deaminase/5-amino-6-(5-phosphoribosylamino)uracil reductase RibD, partial [Chitinophagaceae bacterium]